MNINNQATSKRAYHLWSRCQIGRMANVTHILKVLDVKGSQKDNLIRQCTKGEIIQGQWDARMDKWLRHHDGNQVMHERETITCKGKLC